MPMAASPRCAATGCGLFARYLLAHAWSTGPPAWWPRGRGWRQVVFQEASGEITVDMGPPLVLGRSAARVGGVECRGLAVSLGNPHLACMVDAPVAGFDLSAPPVVDPALFPDGANVEVVHACGDRHLDMRVYERGSGGTLSCGTGAGRGGRRGGRRTGQRDGCRCRRPGRASSHGGPVDRGRSGGRLVVTLGETTSLLTGPAVIVAEGELDEAWLTGRPSDVVSGIV